ncbi:MAG: helix-turn-helix domain-containing protein [Methylococcaceae bacterium]
MNNFSADSVLDRLQKAMSVNSDSALAKALGVNRATLGNWRARNSVPYSICVDIAVKKHISLDWLLIGQGNRSFDVKGYDTEILNVEHEKFHGLFDVLSVEQQQATIQFIIDKKRLNELEIAMFSMQQQINLPSKTE